jgi:ribosomal protein L11 methylase PrmA
LIDHLEKTVRSMEWVPEKTEWGEYYNETNYSAASLQEKLNIVGKFIEIARPNVVWDLGANTGFFSRAASDRGVRTIAFDVDPAAVEKNYRLSVERREKTMLPLLLDLTNPSPNLGWAGSERMAVFHRGPADMVMALALIHHLAISNNVPLANIADLFSRISRWLILEFVPKTDSQVQRMLSSREDVFATYDVNTFERVFLNRFSIVESQPIRGTERVLYLMKSRRA